MSSKIKVKNAIAGDRSGTSPMSLSELIDAVKKDLVDSSKNRSGEDFKPLFKIEEVTIETEVTAQRKIGMTGKADIRVLTIGASGEQTNLTKHKVSINLRALDNSDKPENNARMRGTRPQSLKKGNKGPKMV
jgi:hypothetical protein